MKFLLTQRKLISAVLFVILLISIPLGLYLVRQQQDARSRASGNPQQTVLYDAQKYRGTGINTFFDLDDFSALPIISDPLLRRAGAKWVRVRFDWDNVEPGTSKTINWDQTADINWDMVRGPKDLDNKLPEQTRQYLWDFKRQIDYAKGQLSASSLGKVARGPSDPDPNQNDFNIEVTFQNAPCWTNGWLGLLNEQTKIDRKIVDAQNQPISNPCSGGLQQEGSLNPEGKAQLTSLSAYLLKNFREVDFWTLHNEPNGEPVFDQGQRLNISKFVRWGGHFGYAIDKNGNIHTDVISDSQIAGGGNGPREFAEYIKAFYEGKMRARSSKFVSYTGSMWREVGTNPSEVNRYPHNFDRWVLKSLKDICPENGCFDVMNFHHYWDNSANDQPCHNLNRLKDGSPVPNKISREDTFPCHDPYSNSQMKGMVRRIKYDMSDILGFAKPLFVTEFGKAFTHDLSSPYYQADRQSTLRALVQMMVELRSEGVDGMMWYDLSGRNCEDEGLLEYNMLATWCLPLKEGLDPNTTPKNCQTVEYDTPNKKQVCTEDSDRFFRSDRPGVALTQDQFNKGAVFALYSYMSHFLNGDYLYVKYGGLSQDRGSDSTRFDKGVISYLFKQKDLNKYREVVWNKQSESTITLPKSAIIYRINSQFSQDSEQILVSENVAANTPIKITGNLPVILEYDADSLTDAPLGHVDSKVNLSPDQNGWVGISGWTVSNNKAIDRVELVVDGVPRGDLAYGLLRGVGGESMCNGDNGYTNPDYLYPNCPFVGIADVFNANILGLGDGNHKIEIVAYDAFNVSTKLTWGSNNQTFGMLNIGNVSVPTPLPSGAGSLSTPSPVTSDPKLAPVLNNFGARGDNLDGDENKDRIINELDFGAIYSR